MRYLACICFFLAACKTTQPNSGSEVSSITSEVIALPGASCSQSEDQKGKRIVCDFPPEGDSSFQRCRVEATENGSKLHFSAAMIHAADSHTPVFDHRFVFVEAQNSQRSMSFLMTKLCKGDRSLYSKVDSASKAGVDVVNQIFVFNSPCSKPNGARYERLSDYSKGKCAELAERQSVDFKDSFQSICEIGADAFCSYRSR